MGFYGSNLSQTKSPRNGNVLNCNLGMLRVEKLGFQGTNKLLCTATDIVIQVTINLLDLY